MANYFKELNEAFDKKYAFNNIVESKRELKEAKNDIFSMTLSEYAESQGVDVDEAESWVTLHPEKTISKLYFSEDEESPYTGVVYTNGTISVVGLRYDDDVKDFSTMRKVLLSGSDDIFESKRKQKEASATHAHPDMSKKEGSISSRILSNKDRIDSASSLQDLRDVVADILSPLKDNAKVAEINGRLRDIKDHAKALQYIYNIILKGDNLGVSGRKKYEDYGSCNKDMKPKKLIKEDGAEDFLHELSDTIRTDVWDVVLDDVADAIDDVDTLPDYLPMTDEEANNQFLDAIRKLAEAAFIKYCVYMRDTQVDEGIIKTLTQPIRDAADTVRDVLNIPDKNTKLDEDQNDLGNELDRYQKWVDFDMKRYGKISNRTQQMVHKAGYQILKDDHGDYEVAAGHFE